MIKKSAFAGAIALALLASGSQMAFAQSGASKIDFLPKQTAEERLASNLMGVAVEDANGENIGDVNDLVIGSNGELNAIVIGVGGFLGIGEKNIAVSYETIEQKTEDDNLVVVLNTSKAELEAAPDYLDVNDKPLSMSQRLTEEAGEAYENAKQSVQDSVQEGNEAEKRAE